MQKATRFYPTINICTALQHIFIWVIWKVTENILIETVNVLNTRRGRLFGENPAPTDSTRFINLSTRERNYSLAILSHRQFPIIPSATTPSSYCLTFLRR